jgi:hypothetical protein
VTHVGFETLVQFPECSSTVKQRESRDGQVRILETRRIAKGQEVRVLMESILGASLSW